MATAEVYPGPGVNTYKSTKLDVEIFSGTLYTSAYVYSATMPAWYQLSSHAYGFQLDYSTPPIMSWVNFGVSAPTSVKVSGIGGYQITSVAIFPSKRNIPYNLTNNVVSCSMNTYDQYWLEFNGNRENPLFLFANPFKPAIGNSPVNFNATAHGNIYFSAGVHDISAVTGKWQYPLQDNDRVYIEPGSWIKGGFSAGNSSGISIVGYGTFSQENINPTSINRSYPNILSACMVLGSEGAGYAGFDAYPPTQSRNIIDGPTFTMQTAYGVHFGNTIRNCKIIAPWYYNTDAFAPTPDCLAGSGGLVDHCFAFVGDDVFYAGLHNGYYGGTGDVSTLNCFVGTTGNSIFASYYPNPGIAIYRNWYGNPALQDTSALFQDIYIKTYQGSGPDTADTGMYIGGDNISSVYPTDQTHTNINSILHFHMYLSSTNYGTDPSGWGNRNILFKNIHVEGDYKASLIDIQNRYDAFTSPPSYRGERCGTTSGIRFDNVTFTTSGGIRKGTLIGLNSTNRPHHIEFNNVRIANTLLTGSNAPDYFYTNEFIQSVLFSGDQLVTKDGNLVYIPGRGFLQRNLPAGSLP